MTGATALGLLLAHLVGDYLIQSHWMATRKTEAWWPAVAHGATYTLPFALVTHSIAALVVIAGTHVIIDRYRLARHVVWAKNMIAPKAYRSEHTPSGYPTSTSPWLAFWLLIIADNTLHLLINAGAVKWL